MNKTTHPYFVANGDSRQETAVLLVGTAREFGIDQRDIAAVPGGFRISEKMANVLYDEGQDTPAEVAGQAEAPAGESSNTSTTSTTKKKSTKKTASKRTSSTSKE